MTTETLETVFWRHVTVADGLFDCWLWRGARTQSGRGYGHLRAGGKDWTSNRASWVVHFGSIPAGMSVLHHCDNKICARPDHLYLGTQTDNALDDLERTSVGRFKLNPDLVRRMRAQRAAGASFRSLAADYSLSNNAVWSVCTRRTWRRVA